MNMGWCLQCHRDPTDRIRPRGEVTHLDWQPSAEDASTLLALSHAPDLNKRATAAGVTPGTTNDQTAKAYAEKLVATGGVAALKREVGSILKDQYHINPNTDCITCHR